MWQWWRGAGGFGLGYLITLDAARRDVASSNGEYAWGGYFGTMFFVAPGEDGLIAILLAQRVPGPSDPNTQVRSQFRTLVYGAITD